MFSITSLTDEQRAVVNCVCSDRCNVVVNAVAGSGKTRTALTTACEWLIANNGAMPVLLVAYNKRLELDMSEQKRKYVPEELRRLIEVRTIHGFGHFYFQGDGLTSDKQLERWTKNRETPARPFPYYGLVIVDESQDLTPTLYNFLYYVISQLAVRPQLLILGDPFQVLYGYMRANVKYLVDAELHWGEIVKDAPFKHVRLSICFRISHEMAEWINVHLNPNNLRDAPQETGWFNRHKQLIETWWADGIRANPKRPRDADSMKFFRRSEHFAKYGGSDMKEATTDAIRCLLEKHDIEKTVILSSSITKSGNSPVRLVTNWLQDLNYESCAWYIDGGETSNEVIAKVRKNKRLASTIHRFKGQECDGVVLLGLDGFYEVMSKHDPLSLYNKFYVGATRARKQLLIIEWNDVSYCTVRVPNLGERKEMVTPSQTSVSRLLMHCPYEKILCDETPECLITKIAHRIEAHAFGRKDYIVPGAHHGKQRFTVEDVSSVLSVGIMVRLQLYLDDGVLRFPSLASVPKEEQQNVPLSLRKYLGRICYEARMKREYSWAEILQIALAFITVNNLYFYRWRQTDLFEQWDIVQNFQKLDLAVNNLIELIYEPFCNEYQSKFSHIPFDEKLSHLRLLRQCGRLINYQSVSYDLVGYPKFCDRYGTLVGVISIALLSPADAKRRAGQIQERIEAARGKEADVYEEDVKEVKERTHLNEELQEGAVKIVKVNASAKVTDDDRLEAACHGAMYALSSPFNLGNRENLTVSSQRNQCIKYEPEMYIAYPTQGLLVSVKQHMNAFEFIHRMGFRKMNEEFTERNLDMLRQLELSRKDL